MGAYVCMHVMCACACMHACVSMCLVPKFFPVVPLFLSGVISKHDYTNHYWKHKFET